MVSKVSHLDMTIIQRIFIVECLFPKNKVLSNDLETLFRYYSADTVGGLEMLLLFIFRRDSKIESN